MADRKTKPSASGAQFYQSDAEKKARLAAGAGKTETEKAINKALREKLLAKEMTSKETGTMGANVFVDSVEDAIKRPPKASGTGRAVMKGRGGSFKGVK